jgi:dCTP deaminase
MILTGPQIISEVAAGRIVIDDFDPARVEPNSYGVRLGHQLLAYENGAVDCAEPPRHTTLHIDPEGFVIQPGRLYLGSTAEAVGSTRHAATLYARRSVSTLGVWIQFSAPLGHSGAIVPWTLEITTAHPVRLYAGMLIGKVAFWCMAGDASQYRGKYTDSTGAVASRLSEELPRSPRRAAGVSTASDRAVRMSQTLRLRTLGSPM